MNQKFVPASTEAFPLGIINGTHFSVSVSRKSGFDGFEKYTGLPCLQLIVIADNEKVTWNTWDPAGEKIGVVVSIVRRRKTEIIKHFFGETLALEDAGVRIELNDQNSARRQTVHFHFEVGHKDLFGEDGFVRQCVQLLLKPGLIEQGAPIKQPPMVAWHEPPELLDPLGRTYEYLDTPPDAKGM